MERDKQALVFLDYSKSRDARGGLPQPPLTEGPGARAQALQGR